MATKLLNFLLVEDDDDHAHLVQRNLNTSRVVNSVERVADGVEALRYLRGEGGYANHPRPDVILLDLNMPKMNGHEILSAIKSDVNLRSIPVVVLTTSDAESDRAKAYEHHANSYVVKPLDFGEFRKMVHDLGLYWGIWNRPPM